MSTAPIENHGVSSWHQADTETIDVFLAKAGDPISCIEALVVEEATNQRRVARELRNTHRQLRRQALKRAIAKMRKAAENRTWSAGLSAVVGVVASAAGLAGSAIGATTSQVGGPADAIVRSAGATAGHMASSLGGTGAGVFSGISAGTAAGAAAGQAFGQTASAIKAGFEWGGLALNGLHEGFSKYNPFDSRAASCDRASERRKMDSQESGERAQQAQDWFAQARQVEQKMLDQLERLRQSEHDLNMKILTS